MCAGTSGPLRICSSLFHPRTAGSTLTPPLPTGSGCLGLRKLHPASEHPFLHWQCGDPADPASPPAAWGPGCTASAILRVLRCLQELGDSEAAPVPGVPSLCGPRSSLPPSHACEETEGHREGCSHGDKTILASGPVGEVTVGERKVDRQEGEGSGQGPGERKVDGPRPLLLPAVLAWL